MRRRCTARITGTITDAQGSAVPGATVSASTNETGLEVTTVTDETGTYTIRNVAGGTYTLKASLQGFKEFVQTGIPVVAGNIVRINGQLEVGALTESVTVTTEAALLKTDKADVSVDLRPEEVVNLPLNQYRNYQTLLNLVPGATPPVFQNAQTDTPGRALTTNVNGTNRNNNVTRIDGAASINVWLPHHAGYVAPVETIENVNISTNSFDAAQGMTGGAATAVQTKSGTNNLRGSAFFFRQQDELNARRGYFDPDQAGRERLDRRRHGRRSDSQEQAVLLRVVGAQRRAQRRFNQYNGPDREDAQRRLQRGARAQPGLPHLRSDDRESRRRGPVGLPGRDHSCQPHQRHLEAHPGDVPGAQRRRARTTGCRTTTCAARFPKAIRDNYDGKINWNRNAAHQFWGKFSVMDADVMDLFYLPFEEAGGGETTVSLWTVGQTWTLSPTLLLDANGGSNKMTHESQGPDYGTNYGTDVFGIPGMNADGVTGPGSTDLRALQRHARVHHRPRHAGQQRDLDAGVAHGNQLHRVDQPHEGARAARDPQRASTSCG